MTQLNAVVFDPERASAVTTVTTVQGSPHATSVAGSGGVEAYVKNEWPDWSKGEKVGVIVAVAVAGLVTAGMLLWCACRRRLWEQRRGTRNVKGHGRRWGRGKGRCGRSGKDVDEELAKRKGTSLDSDHEEKMFSEGMRREPTKRTQRSMDTEESSNSAPAWTVPKIVVEGSPGTAQEAFETSGAVLSAPSPVRLHQGIPALASGIGQAGLSVSQPSSDGSGRISAYRAMRAQERRAERARP